MTKNIAYALAVLLSALALPASGASDEQEQPAEYRVDLNKGVWLKGPSLPSARQDAAAAVIADRIYLVGGFGPHDRQMSSTLVFEPAVATEFDTQDRGGPIVPHVGEWTYAANIPEPVDHAAAAGLDGYLYVAGGRIENLVSNKFWRYDPIDDQWVEMPSMPYPRYGATMQAFDGKLYLIGGQSSHGNDEQSLMIFDPQTSEWRSKPYELGIERIASASAVIGNRIALVGGRNRDEINLSACELFDPVRDRWSACSHLHEARSGFGLAVVNNRMVAIGGEDLLRDSCTQTSEISEDNGYGWMNGPWLPFPRHGMAVVTVGQTVWVIGGTSYVGTAPIDGVLRFVSPVVKVKFRGRARK
ncbi:MAG TPA: kelch repeat-containing protein [Candidatus Tumulicola sp.]|nr:kelch repeat-containing protein [Candidatus Tumulicola sp.]